MPDRQRQIIPFFPQQQPGVDPLGGASPVARDIVIDGLGTVRRRPGATLVATVPDGLAVRGMFATSSGRVFVIAGRLPDSSRVYELVGDALLERTSAETRFALAREPVFAETEAVVAIAVGTGIRTIDLVGAGGSVAPLAGGPPQASHVIVNSQRLLANDVVRNKSFISFSAPAAGSSTEGHEQWGATTTALGTSGVITAEARPDPVVALAESTNEVWGFGTTNVQIFAPEAALIFASTGTREFGCSAPYSIVKDDQAFAWLDDRRRIIHSDGRSARVISDAIKKTLDDMARVDDCKGFRVLAGPTDVLAWRFRDDGRTFAFDRQSGWATWTLAMDAHTSVPSSNRQLVGLPDGSVCELDPDSPADLGAVFQGEVITGRIDRGSSTRKRCRAVYLHLQGGSSTVPVLDAAQLFYRDDDGPWSAPIAVDLLDRNPVVPLRALGVYRSRQWRFRFQTDTNFTLGRVIEEFEDLGV